jgi:hypothetical protein
MTEETTPNFLTVVEVKPITMPIAELTYPMLYHFAEHEKAVLVRRPNRRKKAALNPCQEAVVTFLKSLNTPRATADDKMAAFDLLRETLIGLEITVNISDMENGKYRPRKCEYSTPCRLPRSAYRLTPPSVRQNVCLTAVSVILNV